MSDKNEDKKIKLSDLPDAVNVSGTDFVPMGQGSGTTKAAVSDIGDYIGNTQTFTLDSAAKTLSGSLNEVIAAIANAAKIDDSEASGTTTFSSEKITELISQASGTQEVFSGTLAPSSELGEEEAIYIQYNQFAVTAVWVKAAGNWNKIIEWNIVANGYIKIADGLSASDVGTYGENAYIFIDKPVEVSGGMYYEWDIEILNNYTQYLNFTVLGNRNHTGYNSYRIILGGSVGNDNINGSIYNFGSYDDANDIPIIAVSTFPGSVISAGDAQKIEITSAGRYKFLLGDSSANKNNKKFALFALYDWYHGNFSGVNYGYIMGRCPAMYTPFFKLYSLKIWQEETKEHLLHYYTPMISNGHKGVYDNVLEVFYPCSNDDLFEVTYDLSESTYSFINDNQTVKTKTWSSTKITSEISDAVDTVVNLTGHITLTGTLTAGNTSYTFTNSNIDSNALIHPYTSDYSVVPTNIVADDANHAVTLTFEAQASDIDIALMIWKVT